MPIPYLAPLAASVAGATFPSLVGWVSSKLFGTLSVWGVYAASIAAMVGTATFVFTFLRGLPTLTYPSPTLAMIMDIVMMVKPSNFESTVALVITIALTKHVLRLYILLLGQFMTTASKSVSGS